MPRGDGTGPWGIGPLMGRAAGYCGGYGISGYMNPVPGRGFWGYGKGMGGYTPYAPWRCPPFTPYNPWPHYGLVRRCSFRRGRGRVLVMVMISIQ